MSLSVISLPEAIELAGNEIMVKIHTDLPLATANLKIACYINVELVYGSGSYTTYAEQILDPDNDGNCTFFWDRFLLDSFGKSFDLPTVNGTAPLLLNHVVKRYNIFAIEKSGSPQSNTDFLFTGPIAQTRYAYKGAIPKHRRNYMPFFGASGWNISTPAAGGLDKAFFDWRGKTTTTRTDNEQWVYYMHQDAFFLFPTATVKLRTKYYRSDGYATEITSHSITLNKYEVCAFPVGFEQLNLAAYETPTAKITKYETVVSLWYPLGSQWLELSERKTWKIDRNFQHRSVQFSFINSLGVLTQFQCNGSRTISTTPNKTEVPQYWEQSFDLINGESATYNTVTDEMFTVLTGNLTPNEANRLRDLFNSQLVSLVYNNQRVPVRILSQKFVGDDIANVLNYAIEYKTNFNNSVPDLFDHFK
jgi:hypothetical protein